MSREINLIKSIKSERQMTHIFSQLWVLNFTATEGQACTDAMKGKPKLSSNKEDGRVKNRVGRGCRDGSVAPAALAEDPGSVPSPQMADQSCL